MTSHKSALRSRPRSIDLVALSAACLSIVLVTAGLLALCSCAHTAKGLAREQAVYNVTTNAAGTLQIVAQNLPPPIGTIAEGALAVASGLLALWGTHLHRSVKELRNGNGQPAQGPSPPARPAAPPAG